MPFRVYPCWATSGSVTVASVRYDLSCATLSVTARRTHTLIRRHPSTFQYHRSFRRVHFKLRTLLLYGRENASKLLPVHAVTCKPCMHQAASSCASHIERRHRRGACSDFSHGFSSTTLDHPRSKHRSPCILFNDHVLSVHVGALLIFRHMF